MSDPFDFFKEQEAKLLEKPSEQVWKKLEKRLDQLPRRPKVRRRRPDVRLGMVALVLLVLLFSAIMVWWFVQQLMR
jgi:ferric-dicitrate binding protein FerR (iron transport regulator)